MFITKENFKKNNLNLLQFVMALLVIYSHAFPIAAANSEGEIVIALTGGQYSTGGLAVAVFLSSAVFWSAQAMKTQRACFPT